METNEDKGVNELIRVRRLSLVDLVREAQLLISKDPKVALPKRDEDTDEWNYFQYKAIIKEIKIKEKGY